jgi:hypothetical protein
VGAGGVSGECEAGVLVVFSGAESGKGQAIMTVSQMARVLAFAAGVGVAALVLVVFAIVMLSLA